MPLRLGFTSNFLERVLEFWLIKQKASIVTVCVCVHVIYLLKAYEPSIAYNLYLYEIQQKRKISIFF